MRAVMVDSIQSYHTQITGIEALLEELNVAPAGIFREDGATNDEVDWLKEGLQLLVQKKAGSITVLQGGIDDITRYLTPPVDTPADGTPPPPP